MGDDNLVGITIVFFGDALTLSTCGLFLFVRAGSTRMGQFLVTILGYTLSLSARRLFVRARAAPQGCDHAGSAAVDLLFNRAGAAFSSFDCRVATQQCTTSCQ